MPALSRRARPHQVLLGRLAATRAGILAAVARIEHDGANGAGRRQRGERPFGRPRRRWRPRHGRRRGREDVNQNPGRIGGVDAHVGGRRPQREDHRDAVHPRAGHQIGDQSGDGACVKRHGLEARHDPRAVARHLQRRRRLHLEHDPPVRTLAFESSGHAREANVAHENHARGPSYFYGHPERGPERLPDELDRHEPRVAIALNGRRERDDAARAHGREGLAGNEKNGLATALEREAADQRVLGDLHAENPGDLVERHHVHAAGRAEGQRAASGRGVDRVGRRGGLRPGMRGERSGTQRRQDREAQQNGGLGAHRQRPMIATGGRRPPVIAPSEAGLEQCLIS